MNKTVPEGVSHSIHIGKCLAIILVVIGHNHMPDMQPRYWLELREAIYLFHMPAFMFFSGYLALPATASASGGFEAYRRYAGKKFDRLMIPYITVSIFILIAKLAAQRFFTLENPVSADSLYSMFFEPAGGHAVLLWFLYSLFSINLIAPALMKALGNVNIMFVAALLLSYLGWPAFLSLNLTFRMLPYFAFGLMAREHDAFTSMKPRTAVAVVALIIVGVVSFYYIKNTAYDIRPEDAFDIIARQTFVLACIALIAFGSLVVSNRLSDAPGVGAAIAIGKYSASIYLLHTLCMGPVRIFFYDILGSGMGDFWVANTIIVLAGISIPILLDRFLISRSAVLSRFVLGIRRQH